MRRLMFVCLALTLAAPAARAQEDTSALIDRLSRLERDINFLQKQVYRNTDSGASDNGEISTAAPANSGHFEVRLSQMDEQLRHIRGQIEQASFGVRQLAVDVKKLSDDTDYRLRALEQKQAVLDAATAAAAAAAAVPAPVPAVTPPVTETPADQPAVTGNDFPNANAQYSAAFKLVNEKKYSEAVTAFDAFVKKYPADPLTSNAYYWLGESYYSRADYTRAAESFRKGFEVNPEAQKAPDNLLKLALSLNQVKRTAEACIVLAQIPAKYADTAPRTTKRAQTAFTELQCK